MGDYKYIADFNSELCDIANESFALGKKVTAIEESKNIDALNVEELMSSLGTFDVNLKE